MENNMTKKIQELESENKFLKQVLENAPGYFFVVDKDGKPIFATGDSNEIMGIPYDEMKETSVNEFQNMGVTDRTATSAEVLKEKKPVSKYIISKAGTPLWVCTQPVFDENGDLVYAVSYTQNEELVRKLTSELARQKRETEQIINYLYTREMTIPFVAKDKNAAKMFEFARQVAKTNSTIVLYGETGTGKDVMAKYIHQCSNASGNRFIPVNCAAVPTELLESEFFGYEGGAFTGAKKEGKVGLFEMADGGTLFLDEIAELPLPLQPKLLRVLESGEVKRIGSNKGIIVNTRIIAATNKNLKKMVDEGRFREDLYYRLNVIPIELMPLRERQADIIPLAEFFLAELNKKYGMNKFFSADTLDFMQNYSWPGNIRELKNLIERYVVITQDNEINISLGYDPEDKAQDIIPNNTTQKLPGEFFAKERGLKKILDEIEEKMINEAIERNNGNYTMAAKDLKIQRSALYKKIGKYKNK